MTKMLPALASACVLLSGCTSMFSVGDSNYSCSGLPEGVRCMSARDVYAATEYADHVAPTDRETSSADTKLQGAKGEGRAADSHMRSPVLETEREIPVRTPAKVMRVWIAPWEDESGTLHASEYLFKEIEGRRWSIGNRAALPNNIAPLGDLPGKKSTNPLTGK